MDEADQRNHWQRVCVWILTILTEVQLPFGEKTDGDLKKKHKAETLVSNVKIPALFLKFTVVEFQYYSILPFSTTPLHPTCEHGHFWLSSQIFGFFK